jgi:hypothetical protein
MEQLIREIEVYAAGRGILPATVVQNATGHGGLTWAKWQRGATCSLRTAEKIRAYMAANPPALAPTPDQGEAA